MVTMAVCFGPRVLRADDSPVVQDSQNQPSSNDQPPVRRWQYPDPETERAPSYAAEAKRPRQRYSGWLALGYLSAPALGLGLPLLVESASSNDTLTAFVFITGFVTAALVPGIVHAVHGETGRARRAWVGFPISMLVGIVLGAVIGSLIGVSHKGDPAFDGDAQLSFGIKGALVGTAVGAAGFAIFDLAT